MNNHKDTKENLEKEKFKLEILELKKEWYKKVHIWSVILPSLFAVITIIIWTIPSGLLDTKYENLKLEKNILTLDIKEFQGKKDSIIRQYKMAVDSLSKLKTELTKKEIILSNNYKKRETKIVDKLKSKDEIINYYKSRLDSLTTLIIKNSAIIKSLKNNKGSFSSDFDDSFSHSKILTDEKGNYLTTEDGQFLITE